MTPMKPSTSACKTKYSIYGYKLHFAVELGNEGIKMSKNISPAKYFGMVQ